MTVRLLACPATLHERAVEIVGGDVADPPTVPGATLADLLPAGLTPGRTWPRGDDLVGLASTGSRLVVLGEEVIGGCGPVGEPVEGCQEIGYGLAPAYQGRGLGTACVRLLVAELRTRPGVTTLCAEVLPANVPSWRLLERLGFVRDPGDERGGHHRYVLG